MAWLEPPRFYQSLIFWPFALEEGRWASPIMEPSVPLAVSIEVAPPASLAGRPPAEVRTQALEERDLELSLFTAVSLRPQQLRDVLKALIVTTNARGRGPRVSDLLTPELLWRPTTTHFPDAEAFAGYLVSAPVVPFEWSPLGPETLGSLGGDGLVSLVQLARDPGLWIETAGAVVIVKAILRMGRAVSDVSEDAIRYHLPRLLGLPPHKRSSETKR